VRKKLFWVLLCSFTFAFPIYRSVFRELPQELPVKQTISQFSMANHLGEEVTSADLKGRVYIAHLAETNCGDSCFVEISKLQKRLRGLGDKIGIISFAQKSSNEEMTATLKKHDAKSYLWTYLKGDTSALTSLGYGTQLILVDHLGRVRGSYENSAAGINQMVIDTGLLVNRLYYMKELKGPLGS